MTTPLILDQSDEDFHEIFHYDLIFKGIIFWPLSDFAYKQIRQNYLRSGVVTSASTISYYKRKMTPFGGGGLDLDNPRVCWIFLPNNKRGPRQRLNVLFTSLARNLLVHELYFSAVSQSCDLLLLFWNSSTRVVSCSYIFSLAWIVDGVGCELRVVKVF